jgi:mannose-1-phosphate guanylyltransferase
MKAGSRQLDHFHAVILAGGRGTRFWPRSRKARPKQLLPFIGEQSLLRQTVDRLRALAPAERVWVLTSKQLRRQIQKELPEVPRRQVVAEPEQRNTGPAIALAARLLLDQDPQAIMGVFPSDHFISKPAPFAACARQAVRAAARGDLVVLGLQPQWPETGYGYIEFPRSTVCGATSPVPVVRFREKPALAQAKRFVRAGHFYWNSGMFTWRAAAIWEAVKRFMPTTAAEVAQIAPAQSRRLRASLAEHYPRCENVSIDYGVLEKAENIVGFACEDFGWNDVGSWEAVYQLLPKDREGNVARNPMLLEEARGNYVDAPGKLVAMVGLNDLIVVDTADALLICPRRQAQVVSSVVKALEKAGLEKLL